jgi:hypothetical protein
MKNNVVQNWHVKLIFKHFVEYNTYSKHIIFGGGGGGELLPSTRFISLQLQIDV